MERRQFTREANRLRCRVEAILVSTAYRGTGAASAAPGDLHGPGLEP